MIYHFHFVALSLLIIYSSVSLGTSRSCVKKKDVIFGLGYEVIVISHK